MLKFRPPTHPIAQTGVFVSLSDCWDHTRLDADLERRLAIARAAKPPREDEPATLTAEEEMAIGAETPLSRYQSGRTRFYLDAADWDADGQPITMRQYLAGQPVEFVIKRLDFDVYRDAAAITGPGKALLELATLGLREIRGPAGTLQWKADKDQDRVPRPILQALHDGSLSIISEIGNAVARFNQPLGPEEGKP